MAFIGVGHSTAFLFISGAKAMTSHFIRMEKRMHQKGLGFTGTDWYITAQHGTAKQNTAKHESESKE
jgi:predicted nucleic acid-binding Zn ribbon protein